ncbi:DUF4253 domain-containing protein [Streptomyces sp. MZ04]|uniref:DUF4253 domain-containing protein n=1 Tax=Streptomyces sp. MZ04 TaxID=2559236 RepID=UPI00107E86FF|nr:DUF4253 domain-containing protein [Streptomyces sp. MZ04]TGA90938.1 DUF4253 domain-containing protein [Streptomyces sp. MZ04]
MTHPPPPIPLPPEVAEFIEPFEDDPGAPFDHWPGLAPAPVPADEELADDDPDDVAQRILSRLVTDRSYDVSDCHLALVAADRSADIPAAIGWKAEAPLPLLCALLRSWEERFATRAIAVLGNTVYVSVARPPRTEAQALHIALEHVLTTADNVIKDPPTPYPAYAESLIDNGLWSFWWD